MFAAATLLEQGSDASPVVSQVWSLAMQDLTQIAVLVSAGFVGWLVLSLLLKLFDKKFDHLTSAQKKVPTTCKKTPSETSEEAPCSEEDSISVDSDVNDCRQVPRSPTSAKGLAILEQYGVFGASPGLWSR